jgi:hypothetical protein
MSVYLIGANGEKVVDSVETAKQIEAVISMKLEIIFLCFQSIRL